MSEEEEREGFLSRWSRRKRAVAEAPEPEEPPPPAPEALPEAERSATPARPACPIPNLPEVDLASLPRIEELTAGSDFSAFLRPGVPTLLRNAALRRMWSLDPAIRDYIGPVDYQWDFNTPGGLPFGFANELGGEVRKLLAQAIGQLGEEEQERPDGASPPAAAEEPREVAEVPGPDLPAPEAAPELPAPDVADPQAAEPPGPPPRRRHGGALPV